VLIVCGKDLNMVKKATKIGLNFGGTSGVITTLGLIVGLHASTRSQLAVIGGILTIAIADSMSDALGIHLSEESQKEKSHTQVWKSTFSAFIFKFFITLTFLLPILTFEIFTAVVLSVIWGICILTFLSYLIAKNNKKSPWKPIVEHLSIAIVVILLTYYVGQWTAAQFG